MLKNFSHAEKCGGYSGNLKVKSEPLLLSLKNNMENRFVYSTKKK